MANQLSVMKTEVFDVVARNIQSYVSRGELYLPANYSAENAVKSAWLQLQEVVDRNKKPALEVCTKPSIINALQDMVFQGLNPSKKQCYFIVYGNKLQMQRSYFGSMHLAKTVDPSIIDFAYDVVYKNDEFEYEKIRGKTVISKHKQKLENVNKGEIIAAYCSIFRNDSSETTTIMTMSEIEQAWRQSQMSPFADDGKLKSNSTHGKFTADMAIKTVINKACKIVINASDDSTLLAQSIQRSARVPAEERLEDEISENANQEIIDVEFSAEPEPEPELSFAIDTDTGEVLEEADPF